MSQNWKRLAAFIENYDKHAHMNNPDEDGEFFDTWELEMAKAFLLDCSNCNAAVRISKIILALKDVGDIKIKIE